METTQCFRADSGASMDVRAPNSVGATTSGKECHGTGGGGAGDALHGRAAAARTSRCSSSKTMFTIPVASLLRITPPANDVSVCCRPLQLEVRAARLRRKKRGTSTSR